VTAKILVNKTLAALKKATEDVAKLVAKEAAV